MASPVRFAVVRKRLEDHGWVLDRIRGSHHYFERPGAESMNIPVHHNKVKPEYVRKVEKAIEKYGKPGA